MSSRIPNFQPACKCTHWAAEHEGACVVCGCAQYVAAVGVADDPDGPFCGRCMRPTHGYLKWIRHERELVSSCCAEAVVDATGREVDEIEVVAMGAII